MTTTIIDRPHTAAPRGVPLVLHPPGDYISDVIRLSGDFHEADILDELAKRITGGLLIDAGAMIGNHTAYLATFVPHMAIHAFEPTPSNRALLRLNAARFPHVIVHREALSSRSGTLRMDDGTPTNRGHGMIRADGPLVVKAVPLDSFAFGQVALIKIDVEGHEPEVLAGAAATIDRWHPLIVIEDWTRSYGPLLPGYRIAAEWETAHQTFLYEWAG